eukprot:COSAG01_NODE_909_length_12785_cov_4.201876_16_plen_208_part_00
MTTKWHVTLNHFVTPQLRWIDWWCHTLVAWVVVSKLGVGVCCPLPPHNRVCTRAQSGLPPHAQLAHARRAKAVAGLSALTCAIHDHSSRPKQQIARVHFVVAAAVVAHYMCCHCMSCAVTSQLGPLHFCGGQTSLPVASSSRVGGSSSSGGRILSAASLSSANPGVSTLLFRDKNTHRIGKSQSSAQRDGNAHAPIQRVQAMPPQPL